MRGDSGGFYFFQFGASFNFNLILIFLIRKVTAFHEPMLSPDFVNFIMLPKAIKLF
jgi:hypothetical protein